MRSTFRRGSLVQVVFVAQKRPVSCSSMRCLVTSPNACKTLAIIMPSKSRTLSGMPLVTPGYNVPYEPAGGRSLTRFSVNQGDMSKIKID